MAETKTIRSVGLIARPRRADIAAVVPRLMEWLKTRKLDVFYDDETATCIRADDHQRHRQDLPGVSDLLIVLGGHRKLLAAARAAAGRSVTISPVKLGGRGFFTRVTLGGRSSLLATALC